MPLTGDEIRARLSAFAARWAEYQGSERSEAQTFVNELFNCYGLDRQSCGATFEAPQEGRFVDLLWPHVCIVEMKAPAEAGRLSRHRQQAIDYWQGDGAWTEIAQLHRRLDAAVASAYGWTASVLDDPLEVRRRLADLHAAVSAGEIEYAPFAYREP